MLELCRRSPEYFITEYCKIYEPRNADKRLPTEVAFDLRPRQKDLLHWLIEREENQENGIIEKSRDEGMSYLVCALVLHRWLFVDGFTAILGSSKRDYVDKLGDPKCLFYKIRYMLYRLPFWMLPKGFNEKKNDNFLRITNPMGDGAIIGEYGKQLGRSGRATFVLLDEFAFMPNAESVNRAVSQVSNVIIKGSTPQGVGNVFYNERFSGKYPVFTMHWRENPDKDEEWYKKQCDKFDAITVAQEIDIDYTASVKNIVIPNLWVRSAMDIRLQEGHISTAGLDVAADGKDFTTYSHRLGGVVTNVSTFVSPETHRPDDVLEQSVKDNISELFYDQQGVGSGVTTTLKRKEVDEELTFKVTGVMNNRGCTSREFEDQQGVPVEERFGNWAAEQWWALRLRFEKTHKRHIGVEWFPDDECIQIPKDLELSAQLSQPTYHRVSNGKIKVNKFGLGESSPDKAESVMYTFCQVDEGRLVNADDYRTLVTYGKEKTI